jgi:hypothetical protein
MTTPIEEIIRAGSKFYNVPIHILKSRVREQRIALVRFSIMFICRKAGHTYSAIGKAFKRDHGTAMHACQSIGPSEFGALWADHCRFMEFAKFLVAEPDPVQSVLAEIQRSLAECDAQIEKLMEKRNLLLSFRARIEVPEEKAA